MPGTAPPLTAFSWQREVSPLLFFRHSALHHAPPVWGPASRRPVQATFGVVTCTGEDSPFHRYSAVALTGANAPDCNPVAAIPPRSPRWVNSVPSRVSSRTSSVARSRVVAVPVPAVSRSGRVPSRLPGRWGDFPHARRSALAEAGLPLPVYTTAPGRLRVSVRCPIHQALVASPSASPPAASSRTSNEITTPATKSTMRLNPARNSDSYSVATNVSIAAAALK